MPFDDDDDYDYQDDGQTDDQAQQQPQGRDPIRQQMRRLEKQVKDLKAANEAGQKAARELAFVKAGVNTDDPKAKYFLKGYDGELSADAIRAEAEAAGLVAPKEAPAEDVPAAEQAAHRRQADAVAGGNLTGERDWDAEYAAAKTPEELIAVARARGIPVPGSPD